MAKIFVICGHGAGDPGATGNGYTEAERVRALGKRIKALGGNSVMLGDVNRNYYADKGISSLTISKDYQIVELHMDSGAASAKGGHVIIKSGFEPDAYDNALANMLKEILPGRSTMIAKRSDLANPKRAAAKGYGYRLLECGFISNAGDVAIFNSRMDDIARGILNAFGITSTGSTISSSTSGTSSSKPSTTKPSTSSKTTLTVDGYWGTKTTKRLQQIFGTVQDGIVSNQYARYKASNPGLDDSSWEWESNPSGYSSLIKAIQKKVGVTQDGHIGPKTIKAMQKWMGTVRDGCFSAPSACIKKLQQWCNNQ